MNNPSPDINDEILKEIFHRSGEAMLVTDETGCIRFWNQAATLIFGQETHAVIGRRFWEVIFPESSWQAEIDQFSKAIPDRKQTLYRFLEAEGVRDNGQSFWMEKSISRMEIAGGIWCLIIVRDVNERVIREKDLRRAALVDPLSGLANRRGFQAKFESQLQQPLVLALIDIDHFKSVNDNFGHPVGDDAIRLVAAKLNEHFPDSLSIGRMGGDEFGVLLAGREFGVEEKFEAFRKSIASCQIAKNGPQISVSVGVVASMLPVNETRQLLTVADQALYDSKLAGRNCVRLNRLG